jgi:hypothetical protein
LQILQKESHLPLQPLLPQVHNFAELRETYVQMKIKHIDKEFQAEEKEFTFLFNRHWFYTSDTVNVTFK